MRWRQVEQRFNPSCCTLPITSSASRPGTSNSVRIRQATSTAEYRAAAYLRAQCFAVYPDGQGSEFARRAFLRMKGDEKWEEIEQAVLNEIPSVIPMIGTVMSEGNVSLPSLCIPHAGSSPEWIVSTLDINIGPKLPSEELLGILPNAPSDALIKRAYLSNVCVLEDVRRQGIAIGMISAAKDLAFNRGVEHLYVHVIHNNTPARCLYEDQCGFQIESEEREAMARGLNRPRRLLLHCALRA